MRVGGVARSLALACFGARAVAGWDLGESWATEKERREGAQPGKERATGTDGARSPAPRPDWPVVLGRGLAGVFDGCSVLGDCQISVCSLIYYSTPSQVFYFLFTRQYM